MELLRIPRNSSECLRNSWNSREFIGILKNSMEFAGIQSILEVPRDAFKSIRIPLTS